MYGDEDGPWDPYPADPVPGSFSSSWPPASREAMLAAAMRLNGLLAHGLVRGYLSLEHAKYVIPKKRGVKGVVPPVHAASTQVHEGGGGSRINLVPENPFVGDNGNFGGVVPFGAAVSFGATPLAAATPPSMTPGFAPISLPAFGMQQQAAAPPVGFSAVSFGATPPSAASTPFGAFAAGTPVFGSSSGIGAAPTFSAAPAAPVAPGFVGFGSAAPGFGAATVKPAGSRSPILGGSGFGAGLNQASTGGAVGFAFGSRH
ncbi:hypothetical protein BC828DRAFT_296092 [Blastocladiella britannica]|nr:hypothetical protein BC828DRAFT_296092 [Blastocladiella britannica]